MRTFVYSLSLLMGLTLFLACDKAEKSEKGEVTEQPGQKVTKTKKPELAGG